MYYGEDIIITRKGIKVPVKSLHPIGIEDGSTCWGIVTPPNPNSGGNIVPHIIVSPFHPVNWLSLFKITIKLRNDVGSTSKVLSFLERIGFNVFSTECASSGYSHATLNISGTSSRIESAKIEKDLTKAIKDSYIKNESAFSSLNDNFRTELIETFSYKMLEHSRVLRETIHNDGKRHDYLVTNLEELNTLLYRINSDSDEELLKKYDDLLPRSVSCAWMSHLARHRIYSEAQRKGSLTEGGLNNTRIRADWENPIQFVYSTAEMLLKPRNTIDLKKYTEAIEKCVSPAEIENKRDFPLRVVGAFNPDEHYLRINLPSSNQKHARLYLEVRYCVDVGLNKEDILDIEHFLKGILSKLREDMGHLISALRMPGLEKTLTPLEITELFAIIANLNNSETSGEFSEAALILTPLRKLILKIDQFLVNAGPSKDLQNETIELIEGLMENLEDVLKAFETKYHLLRNARSRKTAALSILHGLSKELLQRNITIEHTSSTVLEIGSELETGRVSMILTPTHVSETLKSEIRYYLRTLESAQESLLFDNIVIRPLIAKRIFVSTKFAFLENIKPNFQKKLRRLVNDHGFTFVTGNPRLSNEKVGHKSTDASTERHVTELIRTCDCFLQIFPRLPDEDMEKDKDWLLFELGVARGNNIPFEICIDEKIAGEYSNKITAGKRYKKFNSYQDSKQILEKIEEAVAELMYRL